MRFHPDGPSIPDLLLERCDAGRVVFLCGAGVSLPSGMPTFVGLTEHVIKFFDPPADSDIMSAFRPWTSGKGQTAANVPLDQIFNLLHLEYGKDEVNALVTERLRGAEKSKEFGRAHDLIKRISSSQSGVPQIVTTNFDRLFEEGQKGEHLDLHEPPAFPDLNFGSAIEGITYLHGRLVDSAAERHSYVLSSADFGRAYLSEGWATNFIRHLLERYTVVLVGYQAEDPPIKYLLQGLNHDGKYDRSKLYAFDRGRPEEIEAKWRDRGVTAIAYSAHSDLWETMESWAERADDPRRWRSSIIAKCQQDPKGMTPHERGQVAHVLRTVQGARLFSEATPAPHPEWVCVLDANVRSAKQSLGFGDDAETFDPRVAYGLDDDHRDISEVAREQGVSNDNLLIWRDGDDSPHDFHRIGGAFGTIPKRLGYLITWIGRSIDSPVLAWWAIRQSQLHPLMLEQFGREVKDSKTLGERTRHIWNLILEYHRDTRGPHWNGEWYNLRRRIGAEGWTGSVMREFRNFMTPRFEISQPHGFGQIRPPSLPWDGISLANIGTFKVIFTERHGQDLIVPDEFLRPVFGVLEGHLIMASNMLEDINPFLFETPTCYPDREIDGKRRATKSMEILTWFISLFDRMNALWPELAHAHATTWQLNDHFIFRKLKLYAFGKVQSFKAEQVVKEVCAFNQEIFWDTKVTRELLFLLVDRWKEFSHKSRNQLIDRILEGPDPQSHVSEEQFPMLQIGFAARYARYLELHGCQMSADRSERLAAIIRGIPKWEDGWAISMVTERGGRAGWIGTDESPNALMNLPANEIVARASEDLAHKFDSWTEKRPFTGLVKLNPRKALSALTIVGKKHDYPIAFWASMIDNLPLDITPRLRRVFLKRIVKLPYAVIAELGQTLSNWLKWNLVAVLEFDVALGWTVYDHIIDGFLAAGHDATRSLLQDVHQSGKSLQHSRRTFDHAIAGPIGDCVAALFNAVPEEAQELGPKIPDYIKSRVDRLVNAKGEASDNAVSIAASRLNWLFSVDSDWTIERFIPMLAIDHPASEPAWNGLLSGEEVPTPLLAVTIKPFLLSLFPWIEELSWDGDLSNVAARWLGIGRIYPHVGAGGISGAELRSVLRKMSDETRNGFISWLSDVGKENESRRVKHVIPLIKEDWPKEHRFRTSASVSAWTSLLNDTGDNFANVYGVVKKFLVPVETNDHLHYQFTQEIEQERSISMLFPETTLDLMNVTTPPVLTRAPYELPKVLALIVDAKPDLISDPRYLRLIELVERS